MSRVLAGHLKGLRGRENLARAIGWPAADGCRTASDVREAARETHPDLVGAVLSATASCCRRPGIGGHGAGSHRAGGDSTRRVANRPSPSPNKTRHEQGPRSSTDCPPRSAPPNRGGARRYHIGRGRYPETTDGGHWRVQSFDGASSARRRGARRGAHNSHREPGECRRFVRFISAQR